MNKRIFLQYVFIHENGEEEPRQFELDRIDIPNKIEKDYLQFKEFEGQTDNYGRTVKVGSTRVIQFEDHSDEKGVILYGQDLSS